MKFKLKIGMFLYRARLKMAKFIVFLAEKLIPKEFILIVEKKAMLMAKQEMTAQRITTCSSLYCIRRFGLHRHNGTYFCSTHFNEKESKEKITFKKEGSSA